MGRATRALKQKAVRLRVCAAKYFGGRAAWEKLRGDSQGAGSSPVFNGRAFLFGGYDLTCGPIRIYLDSMKALQSTVFALFAAIAACDSGETSLTFDGNSYSNISKVYLGTGGRVIILYPGGGTSASVDKLPPDFVSSWLSATALAGAKTDQAAKAEAALDRAIHAGAFREVHGVVYDTRKAQSGFVAFRNVKMLQVLEDGAIIDPVPDDADSIAAIFARHLPPAGDTDFISFICLADGTYSYVNKQGDDRTIRAYDYGRICEREDIPDKVLSGDVAFADEPLKGAPQRDVMATLPDSDNLLKSGSGFFVSSDGYLITNHHVVKGAHRVQIKTADGTFPATVVRVDATNDLALVKVTGNFKPLHGFVKARRLCPV